MSKMLSFWGKTFGSAAGDPLTFKPVLHHLLDVAAVAGAYLEGQPARRAREAALVGMEPDAYIRFVALCAGLHDLGKFTRSFQAKVPDLWPASALGPFPTRRLFEHKHWISTHRLLRDEDGGLNARLRALLPRITPGEELPLVAAIAWHHGLPPATDPEDAGGGAREDLCFDAAAEAFDCIAAVTGAQPAPSLDAPTLATWSWRLSGLITLADWVGSDAAFFGPATATGDSHDYWRGATKAARRALAAKGLLPLAPVTPVSPQTFAPHLVTPRPMQALAQRLPLADGPQLFLIEDATGSGKTEAALLLAARLMAEGRAEGLYVALPTMATANAMHERLKRVTNALFAATNDTRAPSLVLAHGGAALARALDQLKVAPGDSDEDSVATTCNAWIADDRRRAFFADIGAGTIDQCFLAVLNKKHLALRQYALAGRILVIDEAHSFDAYMREEFATLLRSHAMNGGTTIVLSATLSQKARQEAIDAFFKGLAASRQATGDTLSMAYPLLTHVHAGGIGEHRPDGAPSRREIDVARLEDRRAATAAALGAAERGAATLVICNAVDEAIDMFDGLRNKLAPGRVHLFHARFAQIDRLAIEEAVLRRFGREAPSEDRAGHILVATQVVEQSLDLDFDLIVSDLAPIDLLIQRAGRLWRHMDLRPRETRPLATPRLLIVSPDPAKVAQRDWLRASLGKAADIYDQSGLMWRSAQVLFSAGKLRTPDDLRPMIEAVYAGDACPDVLTGAEVRSAGKESAHKGIAQYNVISPHHGYQSLDIKDPSEDIGTRLGEPTVRVRLARRVGDALIPWAAREDAPPHGASHGASHVAWALSELKVRAKFWGDAKHPPGDEPLHARARKDWGAWDDDIKLAEVEPDGSLRTGDLRYLPVSGLCRTSPSARG